MKTLSYRQKNQILGATAGVLLVIVLGFSVRNTITLLQTNAALKQQIIMAERAPERIARFQARSTQLGEIMAIGNQEGALRQELFEKIGGYGHQHNVRLASFQEAETFLEENLQVETHELVLEGSFTNQLKVCRALEKETKQGRVVSLAFRTTQDRRSKKTYLNGHVYVQGVKKESDEK